MTILYPIWLLLLIPAAVALYLWRLPSNWVWGLRIASFVCLILAICEPSLWLPGRAGTVVVIVDRSKSVPENADDTYREAIRYIQQGMGPNDQLAVVSFGERVAIEKTPGNEPFVDFVNEVGRDGSNLAEAMDVALSLIPKDSPGQIVVLSDGRWTGSDPVRAAVDAASRQVKVDFRLVERPEASDLAVSRIDIPPQVAPGEAFMITAWVQSPVQQEATFELRRGDKVIAKGTRSFNSGLNRLTFRDIAEETGNQGYSLHVQSTAKGDRDPVPENNTARMLVGVQGPRPILFVTESAQSGLAKLLQKGKLSLKVIQPEACSWTLEELSRYSGVILENVPASKIGQAGMETLATWVRETGSGLMMTGGRNSFRPGGYYRSPLDPILPVSMELRQEHRKLALALVVVMDRSGSMMAPVDKGKVKMDLANLGAARVLDALTEMDELSVIAVDEKAHIIVDMAPIKNRESIRKDILGIKSQGGGIFIYEALAASAKELTKANAGTRHIILFADAMDSEQPGKYRELLEQCEKAGITVSVIGLGTEKDKDADLLRDIAKRGNGRIFFTKDAQELPELFAQDTFIVARSTFIEAATPIQSTPAINAITGRGFDIATPIGGYNLCYLRPTAMLGTVTVDEYNAPVVAAWQAGAGRVLCYTGEADGQYAGELPKWKDVGDYFTSLARWTIGAASPDAEQIVVTQELKGGVNRVTVHLDPERKANPFTSMPQLSTIHTTSSGTPVVVKGGFRWDGPDMLVADVHIQGGETALSTVDISGQGVVALSPICLPYSPEFSPLSGTRGLSNLEKIAKGSGGKERIDYAGLWSELPRYPRYIPISMWLLIAAIVLLVLEVLERRTGLVSYAVVRTRNFFAGLWSRIMGKQRRVTVASPPQDKTIASEGINEAIAKQPKRRRPSSKVRPAQTPETSEPEPTPHSTSQPSSATTGNLTDALRQARERSKGKLE